MRSTTKTNEQLDFLTKISGGFILTYSPPEKITEADIEKLLQRDKGFTLPIIERSKSTHLSYYSSNSKFDGKSRRVQIQWQGEGGKIITQDLKYDVPRK